MYTAVTATASTSATTSDSHIPLVSHIRGSINIAASWNTNVLKKDMTAEVTPSFSAVKKDEPYMAKPENKKEKENITKPSKVRS